MRPRRKSRELWYRRCVSDRICGSKRRQGFYFFSFLFFTGRNPDFSPVQPKWLRYGNVFVPVKVTVRKILTVPASTVRYRLPWYHDLLAWPIFFILQLILYSPSLLWFQVLLFSAGGRCIFYLVCFYFFYLYLLFPLQWHFIITK